MEVRLGDVHGASLDPKRMTKRKNLQNMHVRKVHFDSCQVRERENTKKSAPEGKQ